VIDEHPQKARKYFDRDEVKLAARGRWVEIHSNLAQIPIELLSNPKKHGPCPKCGGKDRFRAFDDVAESGGVICNVCGNENGDGLATLMWKTDLDFPDVLRLVGEFLGIAPASGKQSSRVAKGIIQAVADSKRIRAESLRAYGAHEAMRGNDAVVRVNVYNEHGTIHSYFDLGIGLKLSKGMLKPGKGSSGLFFPGRLPVPGEQWIIVEGVKDASALHFLGYVACGLNGSKLPARYANLFKDVDVVVVHDLDTVGHKGAMSTGGVLHGIARSVKIARLPGEIVSSGGKDVRDILHCLELGADAVHNAIKSAVTWELPNSDGTDEYSVEIECVFDEEKIVKQIIRLLCNLGWYYRPQSVAHRTFQRSGQLVHLTAERIATRDVGLGVVETKIRVLPLSLIRERVSSTARLWQWKKDRNGADVKTFIRPPEWLVKQIAEQGQYPSEMRFLSGVSTMPIIRPSGTIAKESGYDDETGMFLDIPGKWPLIIERPTKDDAVSAMNELMDVIVDFPFLDEAHRSVWVAFVLTLIGRRLINGPTPLFLFSANVRGSGKSLAADVAGIIATGRDLARKTWSDDDDEIRKVITALALEAAPVVMFDNCVRRLGSGSLDAALTSTSWSDRILGASKTTGTLPFFTVIAANGNNLEIAADTARRICEARMESEDENPEDRKEFKHPRLLAWVRERRRDLANKCLTILRAYFVAGCPKVSLDQWGSYEAWSDLIRQCIVWTGQRDPALTRKVTRSTDKSAELLSLLLEGLVELGGCATAREIVDVCKQDGSDHPALREAVSLICGPKPDGRAIGRRLAEFAGRVSGNRKIQKVTGHGGVMKWTVEKCSGGFGGFGGFVSPTSPNDVAHASHCQLPPEKCVTSRVEFGETNPPNPPNPPASSNMNNVTDVPSTWVEVK
jgi:hypothetical protein